MAFEMMNTPHRPIEGCRKTAGGSCTHKKRPCQPRSLGIGNHIHGFQCLACRCHDLPHERHDSADVVAAGELGNHSSIGTVHVDLTVKGVGKEAGNVCTCLRPDQGHSSFITGRFDAENQHGRMLSKRRNQGVIVPLPARSCREDDDRTMAMRSWSAHSMRTENEKARTKGTGFDADHEVVGVDGVEPPTYAL